MKLKRMKKLRLAKIGTNYSMEHFEVIHEGKLVSDYEINKVNDITDSTGIIYVEDEQKVEEVAEEKPKGGRGRPKKTEEN